MDFIELGSPERRGDLLLFKEHRYNISEVIYLDPPSQVEPKDFFSVIESRVTRREFGGMSVDLLSALFWYSAKTSTSKNLEQGHKWHHRPAPSAGGRHPLDHVILCHQKGIWAAFLYDPIGHAIGRLVIQDSEALQQWISLLFKALNVESQTVVWNVAQFHRTSSVYTNSASLIYRDEGAVQATFGLVAEALNLSFCTLGVSGEPAISRILCAAENLRGIGGFCVGERL
jgi:SagB-type dehydrogenase family enzyme